jgi:D-hexose-6-phosphate mutarotase
MMNTVVREVGLGGLPVVRLHHKAGASAEVYLWGATLTSYKVENARELLFVSKNALFDGKKGACLRGLCGRTCMNKYRRPSLCASLSDAPFPFLVSAIRGGVPVVFPQFGQPKKEMAQHGFARTSEWDLTDTVVDDEVAQAVFHLTDSPATRALWPYPFLLSYTLSLTAKALTASLRIQNVGPQPFEAQALLHTYLRVHDITKAGVHGLGLHPYMDKVAPAPEGAELPIDKRDVATIEQVSANDDAVRLTPTDGCCLMSVTSRRMTDLPSFLPYQTNCRRRTACTRRAPTRCRCWRRARRASRWSTSPARSRPTAPTHGCRSRTAYSGTRGSTR